jgi:hypothetical protein
LDPILVAAVVFVSLVVCYTFAYILTDSGRLELKKLRVKKQFDLELAKVGAQEIISKQETRQLMHNAVERVISLRPEHTTMIDALLSDR